MKTKIVYLVMALALVFGLLAAVATPAGAVTPTWYVSVDGNNTNSGLGPEPENAWRDIQYAVDNASGGDTINVAAGTYAENVLIPVGKDNLKLIGAGSDVTTISITTGTAIQTASPITVEGFHIQGPGRGTGTALFLRPPTSNGEPTSGTAQNPGVFKDNKVTGVNYGVKSGDFNIHHWDFLGNDFSELRIGIGLENMSYVNVTGNTFDDYKEGVSTTWGAGTAHHVDITDNEFLGDFVERTDNLAAIVIGSAARDIQVLRNEISNSIVGVLIKQQGETTPDLTNVNINDNNIFDNGPATGVKNEADVTVDATHNWWGDASGPYHENGNHGQGDTVSDNVDYCKWLDDEYETGLPTGPVLNNNTDETYCTIQDAIDAASSGDTVIVYPGKYEENLRIVGMSLTLESSTLDWRDVDLDGQGNGIYISGPGHVTVQGFEIRGFPQDGIHIKLIRHGGSVTILDSFIHDNGGAGISGSDLILGLLTIDGNIITDNGNDHLTTGVSLNNVGGPVEGGTVVITDNVIGAWYDTETETSYSGNDGDGIRVEHIWWRSTVTIGPDNIIAENDGDGIDVEYLDGSLNVVGNVIGGWDFDLTAEDNGDVGRVRGNTWDGIEIYSTRPGSSALIEGNKIHEQGTGPEPQCDGIEIEYLDGSVSILDNIIGAWTYSETIEQTLYTQRFDGNYDDGISIDDVDGTLVIDGNRIAENGAGDGSDGIDIDEIQTGSDELPSTGEEVQLVGSVTISNNDVGNWTETIGQEVVSYGGNHDAGIDIDGVESGTTLTIGPNNNIVDNGQYGIDLEDARSGADVTIFDNTIARNGTGLTGIQLDDCDDVTVDGNTISEHYYGIALWNGSSYNAIINNVITDNMGDSGEYGIGIDISSNSHHNGIVGNLIARNGDGIKVEGDHNDILRNVITDNVAGDSGVHFDSDAEDNVLNYNNIVGNSDPNLLSYGVFNGTSPGPRAELVDARWNWWGDASGPYHGGTNPTGLGDSVSNFVVYEPYAGEAYDYTIDASMPWDTTAPQILTAVAMPDMISLYTAIEGWTEEWLPSFMEYEEEFGFTPGPGESTLLVETTDIPGEGAAPRGIRYVNLDLKGAIAQLMGVPDVWAVQPPEWVKPWRQEDWLSDWHRYLETVNRWEEMDFNDDSTRPVWHQDVFFRYTLSSLYWMYFDWNAGYSKLFEMIEPGEFHIGVTIEDWAGNTASGYIEVSLVDVAIPLEQGWNLRSTPIALDANCWGDITELGDGLEYAIAYRYDSETQQWQQLTDVSVLSPLEGVAIKATSRDALGLVFDRWATAPPVRQVSEGLNLIGLAAGPPNDPWMPADDALIAIEEIRDGLRGYIVVESPQQYLQYHEQWLWDEWELADYTWYFGQQSWTYLHPGDEAVPPVPDMTIGGAYWVYMERDDTLVGFGSTPLFLKLLVERGQDLPDVPRFPATTMVFYMDWMDDWAQRFMPDSYTGLQWQKMVYKGSFSPEDVLTYYETVLPGYGWQMGSKFNVDVDCGFGPFYIGEAIGIGFWKEAVHGGIPYYTDTLRILAWEMDGISFVGVIYLPVDLPTLPGTNLVLWQSAWPGGDLDMQYEGSAMPEDVVNDLMETMSKLQWSFYEPIYTGNMPDDMYADFYKYWLDPDDGLVQLYADVDIEFPQHQGWGVEQPVIIDIERRVDD